MRSGGDLIVTPVHGTHTIDINHAARDVREHLWGVETPEGLGAAVRSRTAAKGDSLAGAGA